MAASLPKELLLSLEGIKGFDKEAFEKLHASAEQVTSIRQNPLKKPAIDNCQLPIANPVPWSEFGYYLSERPSFTFDPLFHAGCYYVQEASSMFLEQVLKQTVDLTAPLKILDLCAAPGGKSTHILSLIAADGLLVSNEVIKSRAGVLNHNISKWGNNNVVVTNNDPADFQRLKNYFDVIVVDAPCSGSGLFRRDPQAMEEWNLNNVQLCTQRQQRILADVLPALKTGGLLVYSTCSYSKEENEMISEWLIKDFSVDNCQLKTEKEWGIIETGSGYRFWPDKVRGEGFFIICFRKKGENNASVRHTKKKIQKISSKHLEIVSNRVKTEGLSFVLYENRIHAIPAELSAQTDLLSDQLRIVNFGTVVGEIARDKLVPDHALAMSRIIADTIPRVELEYDEAVLYLKKKDCKANTENKGWQLVTYRGHALGWINVLANRINNYYPKALRILKD